MCRTPPLVLRVCLGSLHLSEGVFARPQLVPGPFTGMTAQAPPVAATASSLSLWRAVLFVTLISCREDIVICNLFVFGFRLKERTFILCYLQFNPVGSRSTWVRCLFGRDTNGKPKENRGLFVLGWVLITKQTIVSLRGPLFGWLEGKP